ncbi:MAG TPA: efflux RND transporter permease subunit [Candidatus Cloacimonetes bacterium]|nr:efflux RND transporter permease subunit [Candidatus Cloacimonadota bacterium]
MSIAKFSVEHSKLINMIMVIVFILGIYTLIFMPKEEMPSVDFGAFYIVVSYRGVSPEEMENLVVKKLEEQIINLDDVDFFQSTCAAGRATIFIRMEPNADIDQSWSDLNSEIQKVTDLPDDASDPILVRLNMREVNEICTVALGGEFSANAIREIADDYKDKILELPNIANVEIAGTRDREIWIESDVNKLDQYGLSIYAVANAITNRNKNVPAGDIKFGRAEFLIRTVGEFETVDEIRDVIVKMDKNGRAIRIGNVATVIDTLEEQVTIGKLDGDKAVNVNIYMDAEGNILRVMKNVRAASDDFVGALSGLNLEVRNDGSIEVKNSLFTLGNNALVGIILVFITLFIFIGWRNALFAAWGIPFSFFLTFLIMDFLGVTMNNLSLFALILVIGMIVDDAIIVLENVHRYREQGMSAKEAAIKGTNEIMWPVVAAVATTVAAFLPMLLISGMMGKFMSVFPIVVSIALFSSLLECLIILPSHIADFSGKSGKNLKDKTHKLHVWLTKIYQYLIKRALKHRYISVMLVVAALLLALGAFGMGLVKFEFFPSGTPKTIILNLETPVGTSLERTDEVVSKIENFIQNMDESKDVEAIVSTIGQYTENHRTQVETSHAEVKIDLLDADDLTFSIEKIKGSIRKYLDTVPGLFSYKFIEGEHGGAPTGGDIELRIIGNNIDKLESIGNYVISILGDIPGVTDLETNMDDGKKEIKIKPKHDKLGLYGLTVNEISSLVSIASYGAPISKFRGGELDEYDIVVRVQEDQIDDVSDLKEIKIPTMTGDLIPLKELADFEISAGYSQIQHYNGNRVLTVTGNTTTYDENGRSVKQTPDEVTSILRGNAITGQPGLLENFSERFPGYQLQYGGVTQQRTEVYNSLYLALLIALLLIFAILAAKFNSYVQPFIVMLTIPFAIIGVIFGLIITALPFSMMTLIAVLALAGVVVNDSLILVDFVNSEREKGVDRWNSLINAGTVRLRPILMTTVTTIAGFMPILLSTSSQVESWKPIAVSIAFGLAFATLLTLFIIPVVYSFIDSIFGKFGMTRFKTHKKFDECVKY